MEKKLAGNARWGHDSLRGFVTTVCIKLLMVVYTGSFPLDARICH